VRNDNAGHFHPLEQPQSPGYDCPARWSLHRRKGSAVCGRTLSRSRSFKRLSPLFVLLLSGCQWSQSTLEGNAVAEIDIPSPDITKISVTEQLMLTNGYQAAPDANNQEVPLWRRIRAAKTTGCSAFLTAAKTESGSSLNPLGTVGIGTACQTPRLRPEFRVAQVSTDLTIRPRDVRFIGF